MSLRPPSHSAEAQIESTASDWLVRRLSGLSPKENRELQEWLAADPSHAAAFAAFEKTWSRLNGPRRHGAAAQLHQELEHRARTRRRVFAWTSGLAAAAALVLAFTLPTRVSPPAADRPTIAVRPDKKALPDGSIVELNAGAQLAQNFTPETRAIQLLAGEAHFSVAKDPARPFVVRAGDVEVRAIGTAFSVRHVGDEVNVLVTEGRVSVTRDAEGEPLQLGANENIRLARVETAPIVQRASVTPEALATALAWRDRRVEFSGTTVAEAVALFNRHNAVRLDVGDPQLAQHRLSGIFWADDPEGFVRLLVAGFEVNAERQPDGSVRLRRR